MLPVIATVRVPARPAALLATIVVTVGLLAVTAAAPALAVDRDAGSETGEGLTVLETVLWFVALPALLFAVIAVLVLAPGTARGPRYRPGLGWWASPVWFGGPEDPDAAVRAAVPTSGGGGASARW